MARQTVSWTLLPSSTNIATGRSASAAGPLGNVQGMPPNQVVQGRAPIHQQLSFDDLAELDALRASDEANADAVVREILAMPSVP
jgi:hypothetical protein